MVRRDEEGEFVVVWDGTMDREGTCGSISSGGGCALSRDAMEEWNPRGKVINEELGVFGYNTHGRTGKRK